MIKHAFIVLACFLLAPVASAEEVPTDDPTPRERVEENQEKYKLNPDLRGRWNPEARKPASQTSLPSEVSTDEILKILKTDDYLKDAALKIKVTAENGVVTLDGVVNDEKERELVAERAKIDGVTSVVNNLKIKTDDRSLLE